MKSGPAPRGLLRRSWCLVAATGVLFLAPQTWAADGRVCVVCSAPDATYDCEVDGWSLPADDPRLRLYCITELAKQGGHAQCAAQRTTQAPCVGTTKVLASPTDRGAGGIQLGGSDATATDAPVAASAPPDATAAASDPATDEQSTSTDSDPSGNTGAGSAIKDAAQSAGSALGKAGKAIGDTAKKSWNCLTSLFGDC